MAIHTQGTERSRSTPQKTTDVPRALVVRDCAQQNPTPNCEEAMMKPLAAPAFPSVRFVLLPICQSLSLTRKVIPHLAIAAVLLVLPASAAHAQEQAAQKEAQGFSASDLQVLYGWNFQEPGIAENVAKNAFTFENPAAWGWGSSYLFVDGLRSWSEADANAKEVYGEWYPSVSLRKLSGRSASTGIVRDISATVGLDSGVRSTGPAPFLAPPTNVDVSKLPLNVARRELVCVRAHARLVQGERHPDPHHRNIHLGTRDEPQVGVA